MIMIFEHTMMVTVMVIFDHTVMMTDDDDNDDEIWSYTVLCDKIAVDYDVAAVNKRQLTLRWWRLDVRKMFLQIWTKLPVLFYRITFWLFCFWSTGGILKCDLPHVIPKLSPHRWPCISHFDSPYLRTMMMRSGIIYPPHAATKTEVAPKQCNAGLIFTT